MDIRPYDWINTKTLKTVFSLQIKKKGKWFHAHKNGSPLFFDAAEERDAEISRLLKASKE